MSAEAELSRLFPVHQKSGLLFPFFWVACDWTSFWLQRWARSWGSFLMSNTSGNSWRILGRTRNPSAWKKYDFLGCNRRFGLGLLRFSIVFELHFESKIYQDLRKFELDRKKRKFLVLILTFAYRFVLTHFFINVIESTSFDVNFCFSISHLWHTTLDIYASFNETKTLVSTHRQSVMFLSFQLIRG